MRWTAVVVATGALALAPAAAASADAPAAQTKRCGTVAFTPDSEDMAARIRATGLTCGLARDFVADSNGRPGARFRGFRCTSTEVTGTGLPYARYRCEGAGDVIRWRRY